MKLSELIRENPYVTETRGDLNTEIANVTSSSSEKTEKGLFFCIVGARFDAHNFAADAVKNGCVALVVCRWLDLDVPQILVSNDRGAMARITEAFYGNPSAKMKLIGFTGTKGKTTTTYLLKSICEAAGMKCGLIGSTGAMIADRHLDGNLTTPDPIDMQKTLRLMADEGVEAVCMEVSAHAIDMYRVDGMTFEVGCYTNLSQDHLDYFKTMEAYFETKKRFFTGSMVKNASLNGDAESSADILKDVTIPALTFGIAAPADIYARDIEITENGVSFDICLDNQDRVRVDLKLTGRFNVYNALAAASCAKLLGISAENIKKGLENLTHVPGRIEMLPTETPYKVMVDYSHSPDALENILTTVRQFAKGRVICLFGCGGDRDKLKRPIMGRIGGELADLCILTSDNPRTEDPMTILGEIEGGIRPTGKPYKVIENRRDAIRYALEIGREGDIIVLAGKGHETYQEIMGIKRPFDEKVIVSELLRAMQEEKTEA